MARTAETLLVALLGLSMGEGVARACGCFSPPDPANPVVQEGERILFAVNGGQVTAHIQIQYSGVAADFGWLLPLPSVPTLEIGSDELFVALERSTTPYYIQRVTYPVCTWKNDGTPDMAQIVFGAPDPRDGEPTNPLVHADSIGPYDYAVLKADDKAAMLDWLAKNRYFVPAGTESVLAPYVHPGAYFLALKLRSGQSAGDIQPVVLRYASDLPMIPLQLTSVTSAAALNVTVWVLGSGRAIPRNYHHVVLDDAALDWNSVSEAARPARFGLPTNYYAQVLAAVREAPGHHAFLTEKAVRVDQLAPALIQPGSVQPLDGMRMIFDAGGYLRVLKQRSFSFAPTLVATLAEYIKQPRDLRGFTGVKPTPENYFSNFDYWYYSYPDYFSGFDLSFDPVALTDEIEARVAAPFRSAAMLFDGRLTLTRLFTRLAPQDMNSDPVFSFNPSLPEVGYYHEAVRRLRCGKEIWTYPGRLTTEQGFVIDDLSPRPQGLPAALRIEVLREAGPPEVMVDNQQKIYDLIGPLPRDDDPQDSSTRRTAGCVVGVGPTSGAGALATLCAGLVLALVVLRTRRRTRGR